MTWITIYDDIPVLIPMLTVGRWRCPSCPTCDLSFIDIVLMLTRLGKPTTNVKKYSQTCFSCPALVEACKQTSLSKHAQTQVNSFNNACGHLRLVLLYHIPTIFESLENRHPSNRWLGITLKMVIYCTRLSLNFMDQTPIRTEVLAFGMSDGSRAWV